MRTILALAACLALSGCGPDVRGNNPFGNVASATEGGPGPATTEADDGPAPGSGSSADATTNAPDDGDTQDAIKLDVANGMGTADDGMAEEGCDKVDFLFVVDNSGSMEDEQQNLVASFPGFIGTIQNTLMAQDYHIMVVDTDAESLSFQSISCGSDGCTCMPEPQCCFAICSNNGPIVINPPPTECAGMSCDEFVVPTGCPVTLGAGKAEDLLGQSCGIENDARFMTDTQPDLVGTFECVALVGAGGDGNERPMEALTIAIGQETAMGGCHEGFLRDDAILVVTFITDEEDEGSVGDPASWKDALVAAKGGNEEAIVVLGLLGDSGIAGGTCTDDQADDAPKLRTFAESFVHGDWASVCAASYNEFFEAAVSVIDTSCDEFVPEG